MSLPATQTELERIRGECRIMVKNRAFVSAGAATIPVPGADVLADMAVLSTMLQTINEQFGLSQQDLDQLDPEMRKFALAAAGSIGSKLIGKMITRQLVALVFKKFGVRFVSKQVVRFVPLLGQAVAAGLSYGVIARIGYTHIDDCYRVAQQVQRALVSVKAE